MATIAQTVETGIAQRRAAGFVASTITITRRSALRYVRTPQLVVMATLQMSLFFLIYRYMFAGAMRSVGVAYVDFLVPGFIATGVLFSGIGAAVGMAEDVEQGFVDRLRSLPIPRSSVLAGLAAFGLVILFGFAFEWLFITIGLFAGNGQAAQGMGMIVFPFAFISSAYIAVSTMPGWLQAFAKHQPLTDMVDTVRALTLGSRATAVLGHPASHYLTGSLLWTAGILAVAVPLAIWRYHRG